MITERSLSIPLNSAPQECPRTTPEKTKFEKEDVSPSKLGLNSKVDDAVKSSLKKKLDEDIAFIPDADPMVVKKKGRFSLFFSSSSIQTDEVDPTKQTETIVTIEQLPQLQMLRHAYTCTEEEETLTSHTFANWTDTEMQQAAEALTALQVPLQGSQIHRIYEVLKNFETPLCQNKDISYPARFKASAEYTEKNHSIRSSKISFQIEIHNNRKACLIFPKNSSTDIECGSSKKVYKVFRLEKPEVRAYAEAYLGLSRDMTAAQQDAAIDAANEENCFIKFKDQAWISKVYRIFYYRVTMQGQEFNQQVLEMKYYPNDLLTIITSNRLSRGIKLSYSIQLMQALLNMHAAGLIHQDIKPDNILVEENNTTLALNDFGGVCELTDEQAKLRRAGTTPYLPPEKIAASLQGIGFSTENYGFGLDIWSAGCTLWILWSEQQYPWYNTLRNTPDYIQALYQMTQYDKLPIDSSKKLSCLIQNMLRFEPEKRWSALQCLETLQSLQREL